MGRAERARQGGTGVQPRRRRTAGQWRKILNAGAALKEGRGPRMRTSVVYGEMLEARICEAPRTGCGFRATAVPFPSPEEFGGSGGRRSRGWRRWPTGSVWEEEISFDLGRERTGGGRRAEWLLAAGAWAEERRGVPRGGDLAGGWPTAGGAQDERRWRDTRGLFHARQSSSLLSLSARRGKRKNERTGMVAI
jgi:hypothetical protein